MNALSALAMALGPYFIIFIIALIVTILTLRWVGAWMFKINDVINLQREILQELKKINLKG